VDPYPVTPFSDIPLPLGPVVYISQRGLPDPSLPPRQNQPPHHQHQLIDLPRHPAVASQEGPALPTAQPALSQRLHLYLSVSPPSGLTITILGPRKLTQAQDTLPPILLSHLLLIG
jgi:hypothetical protein